MAEDRWASLGLDFGERATRTRSTLEACDAPGCRVTRSRAHPAHFAAKFGEKGAQPGFVKFLRTTNWKAHRTPVFSSTAFGGQPSATP